MRRARRSIVIGLIAIVALAAIAWGGLKLYLETPHARRMAGEKLSASLGMPVEVEDLSVGSEQTAVRLRVVEPLKAEQPLREVLTVQSVTADVSLMDLLTG